MRHALRFSDLTAELNNTTSISFYKNWHLSCPSHSDAPKQKLQERKKKVASDFLTVALRYLHFLEYKKKQVDEFEGDFFPSSRHFIALPLVLLAEKWFVEAFLMWKL